MTRAIRVHDKGGPEVLAFEEAEVGAPGKGQARLHQTAVGLNFIDVYHRTGLYPLPLPFIPGVEGAGIVEEVGEGVSEVKTGERVAYAGALGAYAEARLVPADRLVPIPDGVSDEEAAAGLLKGLTVHYLIRRTHEVKAGETLLVHAAAGGVGLILCQWAAHLGAQVIGTISTREKAELAHAHGCAHPIITGETDFAQEVKRLTAGKGVPVVYDSVGQATFLKSFQCLAPLGLMVLFGQSSGEVAPLALNFLQQGSWFVTRPTLATYLAARVELLAAAETFFGLVASGVVKIEVNQRFALKEAAEAHRALEGRRTTGSTVLIP
ncbi:MAG: quinone oxidoreductase family protein [Caulobacteraceae bacterium]